MDRNDELVYDLNVSPRTSIDTDIDDLPVKHTPTSSIPTPAAPTPTITPSIRLLFSSLSRKHVVLLLLPAILSSLVAGGVAPFMTYVMGKSFDAFAKFPQSDATPQDREKLIRDVGIAALQLIGLGFGSFALGTLTSFLWIWIGEVNAMSIRMRVFDSILNKDMAWFDKHTAEDSTSEGPVGAAGLMAKFHRESDDVRMATSLAAGNLLQYLTTCLACLVLAFMGSWSLTLVILSTVPILVFIQGLSQTFASPLLAQERKQVSIAATIIDRACNAIATVKAFNAEDYETKRATNAFSTLQRASSRLLKVWGLSSAFAQFVMMAMFVQAFWYGAKLVREGSITPGAVMAIFWACLIATSNLQMCIPQFITLAKGKFSMVALLTLVHDQGPPKATPVVPPSPVEPETPSSIAKFAPAPTHPTRRPNIVPRSLKGIIPSRCYGELAMHNVSFSYPSAPTTRILDNVSLFLPANEMTFIVGSSGSGKSTVAQLLLGMYDPDEGTVCLDEQDSRYLDATWIRSRVLGVGQRGGSGGIVLEGKTLFENILMGTTKAPGGDLERLVEEACRAALVHEFVRDLPNGYDTILGGAGGVGLSGGQMQRLEMARARVRNPEVLILDEATSALDPTSRILVFEALKLWRRNKTTIVITHDLSQICEDDFVYVLKSGRVVEQGYRSDLEVAENDIDGRGEFRKMMESQQLTGGFLPAKQVSTEASDDDDEESDDESEEYSRSPSRLTTRLSYSNWNWMLDVVADLTGNSKRVSVTAPAVNPPPPAYTHNTSPIRRPASIQMLDGRNIHKLTINTFALPSKLEPIPATPATIHTPAHHHRRFSLPNTPSSPYTNFSSAYARDSRASIGSNWEKIEKDEVEAIEEEERFAAEKNAIKRSGAYAQQRKTRRDIRLERVVVDAPEDPSQPTAGEEPLPSFWRLVRQVVPTVPNKTTLVVGLCIAIASGAITPIFSFLLSRLLFEVGIGAQNVSIINKYGAIVLSIAAMDGILFGLKYSVMEWVGMRWVNKMRGVAVRRVLSQDKAWFDDSANLPTHIVQNIVKDGDDMRAFISTIFTQTLVVVSMLGVGLVWALIQGWELTLAGFAIAPVFAATMSIQSRLVARCERRNKAAREDVGKAYYETIIHIRGVRSMAYEPLFHGRFKETVDKALTTGVRGAFFEGCTLGVASGLIYLAEALLFYVGALLVANGRYTYLQMVQVLNLVVFSVTIGSQLMAFTERIAKAVQAAHALFQLTTLPTTTREAQGSLYPTLSNGAIKFTNVSFAYPSRPTQPVLKNVNLSINPGECVAIVGSSGSGKSTLAALLQRLYEPSTGYVTIADNELRKVNVHHLRDKISVVSQQPHLFDASVRENIKYGSPETLVDDSMVQDAAKQANVHDFVMSLPDGYDTSLGENASRVSGGQAQRLQIARALVRGSDILILDECTSALDPENQAVVVETIRGLTAQQQEGKTTVMITHKVGIMRMCDRIIVMSEGQVVEEGTYDELVERKGVFATLAGGGEWLGD